MVTTLTLLVSLVVPMAATSEALSPAVTVRLVDLTGDGLLDKLHLHDDGISVSINRGGGLFDVVPQRLPPVELAYSLASDLDGDGLMDLYLVSPAQNVALLGDGTGHFREATERLGLMDAGIGLSAERVDLDLEGEHELLLHNADGDVIFWATGSGFRRDADTPTALRPTADADLVALQALVAQAAELLSLDPEEQIVLGLDESGRPRVALGSRASPGRSTSPAGDKQPTPPETSNLGLTPAGPPVPIPVLTPEQAEILSHQSIVYLDDGSGNLINKTIRFSGVNVQIVNGTGTTSGLVDGMGNLIVGYNELGSPFGDDRTGSHNVVVGRGLSYSSYGGLVMGLYNTVSGNHASVTGGRNNTASGQYAAVSGGSGSTANGFCAAVSGGRQNTASGTRASVSGGDYGVASGPFSSVSGGLFNTASGSYSSVSGGLGNRAYGNFASVSGGLYAEAGGTYSSISGGDSNRAAGISSSVSGGRNNFAGGVNSWVSGGRNNRALSGGDAVSGGRYNTASGGSSSVAGGWNNVANGWNCWVSGGRNNTASGFQSSVSGGENNTASGGSIGYFGFAGGSISGGFNNTATGYNTSVSGGRDNVASGGGYNAVGGSVSGGRNNTASGDYSSVSGGNTRTASGTDDWVAGSLFEDD